MMISTPRLEAPGRVELPTNGLGNRCSIHLSYGAMGTFSEIISRKFRGSRSLEGEVEERSSERREQKNAGLKAVTLNRHSQPRLPGSVVGEVSMRQRLDAHKITKVSELGLRAKRFEF